MSEDSGGRGEPRDPSKRNLFKMVLGTLAGTGIIAGAVKLAGSSNPSGQIPKAPETSTPNPTSKPSDYAEQKRVIDDINRYGPQVETQTQEAERKAAGQATAQALQEKMAGQPLPDLRTPQASPSPTETLKTPPTPGEIIK